MPGAVLVALVVVAASYLTTGTVLLRLRRARATGVLGLLTGAGVAAGVVVAIVDGADAATTVVLTAAHVGVLALAVYPTVRPGRVVDVLGVLAVVLVPVLVLARAAWRGSPSGYGGGPAGGSALVVLAVLFVLVWWRLEHPADHDRWALTWLALSLGAALVVGGVVVFAAATTAGAVAAVLAFSSVGPALVVGVRRQDLLDVRGLVVRFVVLTTALVAYVAALSALAAMLELAAGAPPTTGALALLAALCATGLAPLQRVLRGVVDELLFGRRPDPLGAASEVAGHLGEDPREALDTVRRALVLPYVALVADGAELAVSGTPVAHVRSLPLSPAGGAELRVGLRPGDLDLTRDDRRVLGLVAPLLAQTLRARALVEEVQASREGTVTALEEERRRVRRDLHDGLGPRLSGIAFTTDAARNLLRADPAAADELLAGLRAETVAAIKEVREIAYGLRPPALDELGLVPAVRQQTTRLRTPDGRPFRVRVDAADLPPLTAALEAAAYRIAVEALTNAARHSGGDTAETCLRRDGEHLLVEVRDHGSTTGPWPPGVGTASMRERAAELGGTVTTTPSPTGATVRALLPLGSDESRRPHRSTAP